MPTKTNKKIAPSRSRSRSKPATKSAKTKTRAPGAKAMPRAAARPPAPKAGARPAKRVAAPRTAPRRPAASGRAKKPAAASSAKSPSAPKIARAPAPAAPSTLPGEGLFVRHDLMSTDPERSKAFYSALFGWQLVPVSFGGFNLTRITVSGLRLGAIMPFDLSLGVPSHWVPYVSVSNVDATCKRARELGGTVCMGGMDIPVGRFALCEFPGRALFSPFTPKEPAAPPSPPPAGTFCWDELLTPDAAAARAFYASLFDWQTREMDMGASTYVVCERGGRQVGGIMQSPPGAPHPPMWLAYVAVDDVDASTARGKELGATVIVGPHEVPGIGRFTIFSDPLGAAFAIFRAA